MLAWLIARPRRCRCHDRKGLRVAQVYDLDGLPAGLEEELMRRFDAALAAKRRPTDAEVDLMRRTYLDVLEGQAAAALGLTGAEVYISRATIEVDDPTGLDIDAIRAAAVAYFASAAPTADDVHAVALLVLGETMADQLGL